MSKATSNVGPALAALIASYRQVNGHLACEGYHDKDEDEVVAAAVEEWKQNVSMSDEVFASCANLAGAVAQCCGFLSGIETAYPSLPTHVRQAAGAFGRELGQKWDELRQLIEQPPSPAEIRGEA